MFGFYPVTSKTRHFWSCLWVWEGLLSGSSKVTVNEIVNKSFLATRASWPSTPVTGAYTLQAQEEGLCCVSGCANLKQIDDIYKYLYD